MRHYLTQADLERAVGGAASLRQHLPLPGGGATADPAAVESVQARADGSIRAAIGLSYDLDSFDAQFFNQPIANTPAPTRPMSDEDKAQIISDGKCVGCYWAWTEGSRNQAVPDNVIRDYERALKSLEAMGQRLRDLGSEAKGATSRMYRFAAPKGVGHFSSDSPMSKFRGFR